MNRKFLCIDAQYYLRRNWSVIKNNSDFNKFKLIDSFLWTLLKVAKLYKSDKIILLFDKKPYRKEEVIKNYKGTRYLVIEDEMCLEEKLAKCTDEQEKKLLEEKLKEVHHEADLFREFGLTKYELLAQFKNFGLISMNIPGYEADDLARLISLINEENGDETVLVSSDSDWICMANTRTTVYKHSRYPETFTQLEATLRWSKYGLDPFHYYQINDIYNGGHNDVVLDGNFRERYTIEQIATKIKNNDVADIPEFKAYYDALDVDNYLPDIKDKIKSFLDKPIVFDKSGWWDYHKMNKLEVYPAYYQSIISKLNFDLFGGKNEDTNKG